MTIRIILIGLLAVPLGLYAQKNPFGKLQEWEQKLEHAQDSDRTEVLIRLADHLYKNDSQRALKLAKEAYLLAEKYEQNWFKSWAHYRISVTERVLGNHRVALDSIQNTLKFGLAYDIPMIIHASYSEITSNLIHMGKYDQALQSLDEGMALALEKKDTVIWASLSLKKGNIYQYRSDIQSSLACYQKAIVLYQLTQYETSLGYAYQNLGDLYLTTSRIDSAYFCYRQTMNIALKNNDQRLEQQAAMSLVDVYLLEGKLDSAIHRAQQFYQRANDLGIPPLLSQSHQLFAKVQTRLGNYKKAEEELLIALDLTRTQENVSRQISIYLQLGMLYRNMEQQTRSLKLILEAAEMSQEIGEINKLAKCYQSIAVSYSLLHQWDQAQNYLNMALAINAETSKDYNGLINDTYHQGMIYLMQNKTDSAIQAFTESYERSERSRFFKGKILNLEGLASSYLAQHELIKAEKSIQKSIELQQKSGISSPWEADIYRTAGQISLAQGTPQKAIKEFKTALDYNGDANRPSLIRDCLDGLAKSYGQVGNYQRAFQYQTQQKVIDDSLSASRRVQQIALLQTTYETQKKEREITLLKKDNELAELTVVAQQNDLDRKKSQLTTLMLITGVIILLGLGLYNRLRWKQRAKTLMLINRQLELEQQNASTHHQLEMAEMRSEFLTQISHEFRTPLTLILGPVEQMKGNPEQVNDSKLNLVYKQTKRLLNLINETLDVVKSEDGALQLHQTPTDVSGLIKSVTTGFTPLAEKQKVNLKLDLQIEDKSILLDAGKVEKILINLLANAFRFTQSGGQIKVSAWRPNPESLCIEVQDTGAGIPKKALPHLFDRYYQVSPDERGSGLGLNLCQKLTELHQGELTVTSELGKGSIFILTLPIAEPKYSPIQTLPLDLAHLPNPKEESDERSTILVIEDHEEVRNYIADLLQQQYRVLLAGSGEEGKLKAENQHPDLIVTDIMMGELDGVELTRQLKNQWATSHIPIIQLTAKAGFQDKMEGLKSRVDDYLTKPFHAEELIQRCQNLLHQREQLRQLFSTPLLMESDILPLSDTDRDFLDRTVKIIEDNLHNPEFSVEFLCRELAYNRSGVHLKLKALTGKNTSQFIKTVKLRHASTLLQKSQASISEIAQYSGFNNRQSFNKAFKELFGVTPSEFRAA
ncbi:tetratricopeptide repeat protein [bacterium SCSIO 12741]|nr:tetratricopeptide repeat protein [bacterium SCSIO 12741]